MQLPTTTPYSCQKAIEMPLSSRKLLYWKEIRQKKNFVLSNPIKGLPNNAVIPLRLWKGESPVGNLDNVYKGKVTEKEMKIGLYHKLEVDNFTNALGKPITFYITHGHFVEPTMGKKTILFLGEKGQDFESKLVGEGAYCTTVNPWYVEFDQKDMAKIKTPSKYHEEIVTATVGKTKYKFISDHRNQPEPNHVNGKTYKEIVQTLKDYQQKER